MRRECHKIDTSNVSQNRCVESVAKSMRRECRKIDTSSVSQNRCVESVAKSMRRECHKIDTSSVPQNRCVESVAKSICMRTLMMYFYSQKRSGISLIWTATQVASQCNLEFLKFFEDTQVLFVGPLIPQFWDFW